VKLVANDSALVRCFSPDKTMFPAFINGLSCLVKTPDRRRGFLDFGITQKSSHVICSEFGLLNHKKNKAGKTGFVEHNFS